MITAKLSQWLIEQIGHELTAHQDYLGIAIHFQRQSLFAWGKLFNDQAMEEAQHATRIMNFLVDNEVEFDLPPLPGATTQFDSALKAAEFSLASEQAMSDRFRAAARLALDEPDHTTHQFLQWFLAEQVEEEAKMQHVIDLLRSGINLYQAEPLLESVTSAG